jgi:hypothetical protein
VGGKQMARKKSNVAASSITAFVAAPPSPVINSSNSSSNNSSNNQRNNKNKAKLIIIIISIMHQRSSALFAGMFSLASALALFSIWRMSVDHPYDDEYYKNSRNHEHDHQHEHELYDSAVAKDGATKSRQYVVLSHPRSVHTELQSKIQTEQLISLPLPRQQPKETVETISIPVAIAALDVKRKSSMEPPNQQSSLSESTVKMKSSNHSAASSLQQQQQQQTLGLLKQHNPILRLFYNAGVLSNISSDDFKTLPNVWKNWKDLYFDNKNSNNNNIDHESYEPIILGMQTCREYRQRVPLIEHRYTAPAGLFNTGTNALEFALKHNINIIDNNTTTHRRAAVDVVVWQVPWGKHRMVDKARLRHVAPGMQQYQHEHCLPIVIIRDPYHWLQSMVCMYILLVCLFVYRTRVLVL